MNRRWSMRKRGSKRLILEKQRSSGQSGGVRCKQKGRNGWVLFDILRKWEGGNQKEVKNANTKWEKMKLQKRQAEKNILGREKRSKRPCHSTATTPLRYAFSSSSLWKIFSSRCHEVISEEIFTFVSFIKPWLFSLSIEGRVEFNG